MRRWLLALWWFLLSSLGCGTASPGAQRFDAGSDDLADSNGLADSPGEPAGDEAAFWEAVVSHPGGETSDFGDGAPLCPVTDVQPMSLDQLEQALGRDVKADVARLEGGFEGGIWWSDGAGIGGDVSQPAPEPDARGALRLTFDSSYLERRVADVEGQSCPDAPRYRMLARLRTSDGRLSGAFYVHVAPLDAAEPQFEYERLDGHAVPDLRDFDGTLRPGIDLERPHYALMFALLSIHGEQLTARFRPTIFYTEDGQIAPTSTAPVLALGAPWPFDPRLFDAEGDPAPLGVTRFDGSAGAPPGWETLSPSEESVDETLPGPTLDEYEGSKTPPSLRISVELFWTPSAELRLSIEGEPQLVVTASASEVLEVGRFPLGARVSVSAVNQSAEPMLVMLRVGGVGREGCPARTASCNEMGCDVEIDYTLVPLACDDHYD